jgi:murein DD-endopeptidase MepM/ murein hydrolase activator NlpD
MSPFCRTALRLGDGSPFRSIGPRLQAGLAPFKGFPRPFRLPRLRDKLLLGAWGRADQGLILRKSVAAAFVCIALVPAVPGSAVALDGRAQPGRHLELGSRLLARGARGEDVAALQLELAWHGFPSGRLDGHFGAKTDSALRFFQDWAQLTPDGRAGPATFAALRRPLPRSPIALTAPSTAPRGDGFGLRGDRFHSGLDFLAPAGAPITAAARGRVVFATRHAGGWGKLVVLEHGSGVRTLYAHLARIDVRLGRRVAARSRVGLVGGTGRVTGPHLHFEVRLRGAAVDPATALGCVPRDGRRGRPGSCLR